MTLKGFSQKYGVPYSTVYESSYGVKAVPTLQRDMDYLEEELFKAVSDTLTKRIKTHSDIAKKYIDALFQMNKVMEGMNEANGKEAKSV